jgi:hypothetical protein
MQQIKDVQDDKDYKRWIKRGQRIEKRYRDERNRTEDTDSQKRYNSLWANTQILLPALYGRCPLPVAERRFRDKDPVGRGAAQILERGLRNEIEICGYDEALRLAVQDYLLPGRGTVWVRYEPELEESVSVPSDSEVDIEDSYGDITSEKESDSEEKLRSTGNRIKRESTPVDYIQWTDFFTFPARARTWREVVAVGKRVYMTRDQLKRRFGDKIGKEVPLQQEDADIRRQNDADFGTNAETKAEVYEIWSRTDETVFWVAEGYDFLCDKREDPWDLENFFPCPRPLYANPTANTLVPVPDYIQYQDQAIQIDELTQRIAMLARACKVAGVYNAAAKSIQRLLSEAVENELIPVDDWAAFAEKGGVAGNISLLPLKEIIGVINELTMIKQKCVEEMDRLTGINDIMRGTSDARETLGGVRLKSNNTGSRLQWRQNEVARFARDTLQIMADIMCEHFSPISLIEVSGALYTEGLGAVDMPSLSTLQGPVPPSPPSGAQAPGVSFPPGGPSLGPPGGGPPASAPPGGPPFSPPAVIPQGGPPAPMQPPMGPPQPQMSPEDQGRVEGLIRIMKAIKLLRDERLRGFRVDLEVDSTIFSDQQTEKEERTQFITQVTAYLQQALQLSVAMPEATPLLGKFLQFAVRGYRVGRDLEVAIEDFCDEATTAAKQLKQEQANKPNPEEMKMQVEMMKAKNAMEVAQIKNQGDQVKAQHEVKRQEIEAQSEAINNQIDLESKQSDMEIKRMEIEIQKIQLQIELAKLQASERQQAQQAAIDEQKMMHEAEMAQHESFNVQATQVHEMDMMAQQQAREQENEAFQQKQAKQQMKADEINSKAKLEQTKANAEAAKVKQKAAAAKPKPASKK